MKPQGGISTREEPQPAVDTIPLVSDWSQPQQKALESALASVPKTAEDRWGDISALVPDKTKVFLDRVLERNIVSQLKYGGVYNIHVYIMFVHVIIHVYITLLL